MMKRYEKLLIIAIVFKLVGIFLASQLPRIFLSTSWVPVMPGRAMEQTFLIAQFVISYLENGGIAFWLYQESRSGVWTLFGFIFGIPALLVFYLMVLSKKISDK